MVNIKKVIDYGLEVTRKWNVLQMIFVLPLYIFLMLLEPYYAVAFGKLVSQNENNLVKPVTSIEYYLGFPGSIFAILFLILWIAFLIVYIISKQNRIKAYYWNTMLHVIMMTIVYYNTFVGLQFFVPFLLIRLFYWFGFIASIIYILYMFIIKTSLAVSLFNDKDMKKLTNSALFLWLLFSIINIFINGFRIERLFAQILFSLFPLLPILLCFVMLIWYRSAFSKMKILIEVNKDQERYRQELSYSVEEWYGKKSKIYKESLKKGQIDENH